MALRPLAFALVTSSILVFARPAAAVHSTAIASADSVREAHLARVTSISDSLRHDPKRADLWLALGRLCVESGEPDRARQAFARASTCANHDSVVWLELARAWKRDWLYSAERASLDSAQAACARACMEAPDELEAWTLFAGLALLRGHPREGLQAALHARAIDPGSAEALLVTGAACHRLGMIDLADSSFARAREHLGPELIERFDGLPGEGGAIIGGDEARAAWAAADPDLTTPENEARLDYLTRLALVSILFREGHVVRWDMRTELFLEYGPPGWIEYNPAFAQLGSAELEYLFPRRAFVAYAPEPQPYPYNLQVWHYPELGMSATLWDRSLSQHYDLPVDEYEDAEALPSPELMARNGLVGIAGARGAYHAAPPGARILELRGVLSRFPGTELPRVLASVFAPGTEADSLIAAWAMVDGAGHVVARDHRPLLRSWCDPERTRFTAFDGSVPPGDYRLDISVRGAEHRYGVAHLRVHIDPTPASLIMSDLVLLCGDELSATAAEGVRLEPDPEARVSRRRALTIYYELDHLVPENGGGCRFAYTYEIRHAKASGSAPPVVQATREESFVGGLRRQFVSIPLADVHAGKYDLRITVRDLVGGSQITRVASFQAD
jgi:tetratricopeptide (TPR) repeat protein